MESSTTRRKRRDSKYAEEAKECQKNSCAEDLKPILHITKREVTEAVETEEEILLRSYGSNLGLVRVIFKIKL